MVESAVLVNTGKPRWVCPEVCESFTTGLGLAQTQPELPHRSSFFLYLEWDWIPWSDRRRFRSGVCEHGLTYKKVACLWIRILSLSAENFALATFPLAATYRVYSALDLWVSKLVRAFAYVRTAGEQSPEPNGPQMDFITATLGDPFASSCKPAPGVTGKSTTVCESMVGSLVASNQHHLVRVEWAALSHFNRERVFHRPTLPSHHGEKDFPVRVISPATRSWSEARMLRRVSTTWQDVY